jgi:hypothetical protein
MRVMEESSYLRRRSGEQRSHQGTHSIKGGGRGSNERGVDCGREPVKFLRDQWNIR